MIKEKEYTCRYSLILPTFNMSGKIESCLDSILSQMQCDFEVVVINDGSTDNTREIVEQYIKRDDRIKLYNYENRGVTTARNRGLDKACGEYIIFVDPDDRVKPDLFQMLEPYTEEGIDLIRFGAEMVGGNRESAKYSFNLAEITDDILSGHQAIARWNVERRKYAAPWLYCAKKSIYDDNNIRFPEEICAHDDFATMPIVIASANTVKEIDYIGYEYIQHSDSIGHQTSKEGITRNMYDFMFAYDFVLENLRKMLKNDSDIDFNKIAEDLFNRLETKIFYLKPDIKGKFIRELAKRYKEISYTNNSLYDLPQFGTRDISDKALIQIAGEEFRTDFFQIARVGDYIFNIDGKPKRIGVQRVRKIKSVRHNYFNDYLVFSNIDYNELVDNEEYREVALEALLSDTNLLMATGCNNGYTGDIIIDLQSGKPRICFDNDIIYFARELPVITRGIEEQSQIIEEGR